MKRLVELLLGVVLGAAMVIGWLLRRPLWGNPVGATSNSDEPVEDPYVVRARRAGIL